MVSDKPSTRMAWQMDMSPPLDYLVSIVHMHRRVGVRSARQTGIQDHEVALQTYVLHNWCAYSPAVACGGPDP
jgi:hypothetical protein